MITLWNIAELWKGVLKELGAESKKKLVVLNKMDLLGEADRARLRDAFPESFLVSAAQNQGTPDLISGIRQALVPVSQ